MTYNIYLKEKILNLYLISQKIGKHSILEDDFDFLNHYFKHEIKPNIYHVSDLLQNIIKYYESNLSLQNKIGLDFLNQLIVSRKQANKFIVQTEFKVVQISFAQKKELEEKYTILADIWIKRILLHIKSTFNS